MLDTDVPVPPSDDAVSQAEASSQAAEVATPATGEEQVSLPLEPVAAVEDDRDLIVIEDEAEPKPTGPNPRPGRVRRQEYRQLFARMRRG